MSSPAERPDPTTIRWGLGEAVGGFIVGFVVANVAVALALAVAGHRASGGPVPTTLGTVVGSLVGLWVGLVGGPLVASRHKGTGRLSTDFGLALRPWPDLPLGAAVGAACQLVLLPVLYLPLRSAVPDLSRKLSQPTHQLTGGLGGGAFVVVALLVTVGSPVVEELFFRGLVQRALEKRLGELGPRLGPALSVVIAAVAFGLAHDQSLQLFGLVAFGIVLGAMARLTGRLGPGMVAHASFNAVAVVAITLSH